jgi:hypothetical protein
MAVPALGDLSRSGAWPHAVEHAIEHAVDHAVEHAVEHAVVHAVMHLVYECWLVAVCLFFLFVCRFTYLLALVA